MKNVFFLAIFLMLFSAGSAQANTLADTIRADREFRSHIRSMHILHRPYRPGHFYGNTVRRRHHEGASVFYGR